MVQRAKRGMLSEGRSEVHMSAVHVCECVCACVHGEEGKEMKGKERNHSVI